MYKIKGFCELFVDKKQMIDKYFNNKYKLTLIKTTAVFFLLTSKNFQFKIIICQWIKLIISGFSDFLFNVCGYISVELTQYEDIFCP